jgi:dihydrofolate reductase
MNAIFACDIDGGIAKNGSIPWKCVADLKFFRKMTVGKTIAMGRTTYFSLPDNYRPLPNRLNIVLTSTPESYENKRNDNVIFTNVMPNNVDFIIGGKYLFKEYIHLCETIYITTIKKSYDCDLFYEMDLSGYEKEIICEEDECEIAKYSKKI